ncbi:Predicted P-loop ATPase [Serratia liquefaciens]|uniref:YobI family P-loop NTPase n=1 Tax=Serratia liquefaciens TaxID=614 RepID=UPI002176F684|nr:P-loop NTPase fold protein [Serratia liquefaciens]CAI1909263.1 Predicted P-loop ATPase [Serratia liquefaciens]
MIVRQNAVFSEPWGLVSLTPEYIEAEHVGYVTAIQTALADDQIRNIALSGNYGVGKSSILQEVARRQDGRVVEISLSTLSPIEASKLDDSVPKQATTPTNRIQQEIVKQLLYREKPSKTPGSRFRRIERFRWKWEAGTAALLGFVVSVIFLLTGWTAQIVSAISSLKDIGVWIHAIIFGVATGSAFLVRWRFYGKLHIKQFSAGSATVTLDDNSVSYFDQYLDEIVYFFEVSDRNVVIFEDIDRFNDSHIFETLRALNTLLNASPQIKKPIRFIYAVKDSIFDHIAMKEEGRKLEGEILATDDPALVEVVRANRTKFFDLIIPVVPFITHRSARNLAVQQLGQMEHEVASELIDLAAQYVPDMRLLKNVRNEFIIFRDRIFSGDGEQLNLNKTDLFAMMLYKNTHLTDFEAIRLGKSKLDTLYKVSREVVTKNIEKLEDERTVLRHRLEQINGAASRCEQLGERLIAHVKRTAEAVNFQSQNPSYSFEGGVISLDDLKGVQFWTDFVIAEGNPILNFRNRQNQTMNFTRDNLASALGETLDAKLWDEAERESITDKIEEKNINIKFLRRADLGDLVKRPDFLVTYKETHQSLETIAKWLLKPGLAYQLVRAGYINRNFTLYTSTFHSDRVSPAATNFIIHHVERDLMDAYFELAPEDVDAVVRERGKEALKESALYNIAILDHLLATDTDLADIMIHSLLDFRENSERFIQAYLAAGEQRPRFIERFTIVYSRIIVYLVSQTTLDDVSRLQFVNIALTYLPSLKQRTDSAVSVYLLAHYTEFTALMSEATKQSQAERIGILFADSHITVPRLQPLGRQTRLSFVSRNLYEVTYENLVLAINNAKTVALDVIHTSNKTVYDYVLEHLSTYLEAIDGVSMTIDATEYFIAVIEDVLGQDSSLLNDVIERAASNCEVADLTEVSKDSWQALAEHRRFPATFSNVSRYVEAFGVVDAQLAKVLAVSGKIIEVDTAEDESKTKLAIAILVAKEQLTSATLRVELVTSLDLGHYLDTRNVMAEVGVLFALLLKHNIIADDADSYEHLSATDWPTRRAFIYESKTFAEYMTPELVHPDLAELLTSDVIDLSIKNLIVEQAAVYVEIANSEGINELARFATLDGQTCQPAVVQKMAQRGASAQLIILLLEPHLASITRELLFSILQSLEGDYPKLTKVGYDKPRISNTPADLALLERLKQDGIVGKYDEHESPIRVNKKYK